MGKWQHAAHQAKLTNLKLSLLHVLRGSEGMPCAMWPFEREERRCLRAAPFFVLCLSSLSHAVTRWCLLSFAKCSQSREAQPV